MLLTEAPLNPRRNREKSAEVRNNEKNQEMDLYGGRGGGVRKGGNYQCHWFLSYQNDSCDV